MTSDELDTTDPCDADPTYDFVSRNFRAAFSFENSDIVVECTGIANEESRVHTRSNALYLLTYK